MELRTQENDPPPAGILEPPSGEASDTTENTLGSPRLANGEASNTTENTSGSSRLANGSLQPTTSSAESFPETVEGNGQTPLTSVQNHDTKEASTTTKEGSDDSGYMSVEREEMRVQNPDLRAGGIVVPTDDISHPAEQAHDLSLQSPAPPAPSSSDFRPLPRAPYTSSSDHDSHRGPSFALPISKEAIHDDDENTVVSPSRPSSPTKPPRLDSVVLVPPSAELEVQAPEPVTAPPLPTRSLPRSRSLGARPASFVEQLDPRSAYLDPRSNSAYSYLPLGGYEWRQYTHPNGSLYWTCPTLRVTTDELPSVESIDSLRTLIRDIEYQPDSEQWEFYLAAKSQHFVHHGSRSMSKDARLRDLFIQMDRARTNIETRFELESAYWKFVQTHPNHVMLSRDAEYDAQEALLWCLADRRLFDSSNAPFEKDVAQEMLSILQQVAAMSRTTLKVWFIAAVMRSVVQERIASHFGTMNARNYRHLERADEVPDLPPLSSFWPVTLWNLLALVAFGTPFSYLKQIINVDRSNGISTARWQAFLKGLCAEWADSNLLSIVLVSGAVAMFAVPGLNVAARISAFQSILCALGAVLTGMLLISTHRSRIESNGHTAYLYFNYAKRVTGSAHILAIILSLPLVLTLWAMLWFVLSVVLCAYKPNLPEFPPVNEKILRASSIFAACALVVMEAMVAWYFGRQRISQRRAGRRRVPRPNFPQHGIPGSPNEAFLGSGAVSGAPLPAENPMLQDRNAQITPQGGLLHSASVSTLQTFNSHATPVTRAIYRPRAACVQQQFGYDDIPWRAMYRPPSISSLPPSYSSPSIAGLPFYTPQVSTSSPYAPQSTQHTVVLPVGGRQQAASPDLLSVQMSSSRASTPNAYRPSPLGAHSYPPQPLATFSSTSLPGYSFAPPPPPASSATLVYRAADRDQRWNPES